jgi:hypothetical protein
MLRTSGDSKRRFLALTGFVGLLLGTTALVGLAQRNLAPPPAPGPVLRRVSPEERERQRNLLKKVRVLGVQKNWSHALAVSDDACREEVACPPQLNLLRHEAALRLDRPGSAERYAELIRSSTSSPTVEAGALALSGDRDACQSFVEKLLNNIDLKSVTGNDANEVAWSAVLLPGLPPQPEKVVALAEHAVAHPDIPPSMVTPVRRDMSPEFLNTLGVTLYRVGRDADAITRLSQAEKLRSDTTNWPFLALTHQRLGHTQEARQWAARYRASVDGTFGRIESSRLEKLLFLRELDVAMPATKK